MASATHIPNFAKKRITESPFSPMVRQPPCGIPIHCLVVSTKTSSTLTPLRSCRASIILSLTVCDIPSTPKLLLFEDLATSFRAKKNFILSGTVRLNSRLSTNCFALSNIQDKRATIPFVCFDAERSYDLIFIVRCLVAMDVGPTGDFVVAIYQLRIVTD